MIPHTNQRFPIGSFLTDKVCCIMGQRLSTNRTVPSLWIGCVAMTVTIFLGSWLQGSPSSQIDTAFWIRREITEFGLTFKLPRKYKEKHWDVTVGPIVGRRFFAGIAVVDFEVEERTTFDNAKTRFQLNYDDYREWTDEIRGHKVLIQTFQGGGSIHTEKGVFPPHQVTVVCELDTDRQRFLRIGASCATKEEQEEILAMVGTLEFSKTTTTEKSH
jgi:hypothetical protein